MIHVDMRETFRRLFRSSSQPVRLRLSSAFLVAVLGALPTVVLADTIYLKNGRKIVATVTHEDSKQVFYERAGGEIAIPRSIVDRIEKSPLAVEDAPDESPSPRTPARDLPLPPVPALSTTSDAQSQVVKDNAIDKAYLDHLDNEFMRNPSAQNRRLLVEGFEEAAIFLTRQGDPEAALEQYRHALKFAPDDLAVKLSLAYLLVKQNHHQDAIDLLLPAATQHPKEPSIPLLLGSAYYATEKMDRAIEEWKKSLAIADNPKLRDALARAERERAVAGSYLELPSEHFLLRCESQGAKAMGEEVLKTLEAAFRDLERDLDVYPRETIIVLVYPNEAFRDITRSASWVGALNDGKIRVPVSGLTVMTPDLARVLKHELTHSFVRQVTLGHCPVWFNEGLAQLEEGATTAGLGTQLARAFSRIPSYRELEGSFMGMSAGLAAMSYAKSLAAFEYMRDTFGLGEIRRLLKGLSANPGMDSLLQSEIRLNYSGLEQAVGAYIDKRYGSP